MKTNVFVKTKNVKRFVGMMEDLKKLPPNIPKLALVYGDHGIGKTKTLIWWATKNDMEEYKYQYEKQQKLKNKLVKQIKKTS